MSRTILIVDDEEDSRALAQLSLEMVGGWAVRSAGTGMEALDLAAAMRPDAILMDVMMPDLDGPATLERLRAHPATRDIPVIFLTARTREADRVRYAGMSVSGVLSKPIDPMNLPRHLAAALGWRAGAP